MGDVEVGQTMIRIESFSRVAAAAAVSFSVIACASSPSQSTPSPVIGVQADAHEQSPTSIANDHASPNRAASPLSEQEAYERAKPVFQRYCAGCHTSSSGKAEALRHFSMDSYPFGGHHADQVATTIRDVLGVTGKAATMPLDRPGAVRGEELRVILDWADAFDRAHPPSDHHGH